MLRVATRYVLGRLMRCSFSYYFELVPLFQVVYFQQVAILIQFYSVCSAGIKYTVFSYF